MNKYRLGFSIMYYLSSLPKTDMVKQTGARNALFHTSLPTKPCAKLV